MRMYQQLPKVGAHLCYLFDIGSPCPDGDAIFAGAYAHSHAVNYVLIFIESFAEIFSEIFCHHYACQLVALV